MQGFMNRPIMADAPRWFLDKEMTRKCNIPPSPFVPYWVVAQREDTDVNALQGLIDIAEEEELEEDPTDEFIQEYKDSQDYGIEDLDDEDFDSEDYDNEDYDNFIDEKF